jgi:hypothetical protein
MQQDICTNAPPFSALDMDNGHPEAQPKGKREGVYLSCLLGTVLVGVAVILLTLGGLFRLDHFAAIDLDGDAAWYRDFAGRFAPAIQDQDIFYNNIGGSIAAAKRADIIILGPSFASYAFDRDLLLQFAERHGLSIYNMAFIGIRGGEFSRRIIKRWDIHPKLWVINADDQIVHFFSPSLDLTIGPTRKPIPAAGRSRLRSFLVVAGVNVRWRLEDAYAALRSGHPTAGATGIYRNVEDGSVILDINNPRYDATDNPVLMISRDQNCHATRETMEYARDYLSDIGGNSLLTVVPHSQYCPLQARELAQSLSIQAIIPPAGRYTTVDGGGHLDRLGARTFTKAFLAALESSEIFKQISKR